jgi:glucose-6-phosphate 1-epimerase
MAFIVNENGATLLSWSIAAEQKDVFFCSSKAVFEKGKAVRGGVPICFPWFGPKEGKSQHGFLRNDTWEKIDEGHFTYTSNHKTKELWPYDFDAHFMVKENGNSLNISFKIANKSSQPFEYTFALHSYFLISKLENVRIKGLCNIPYFDKTNNGILKIQEIEDLSIDGEIDRIYLTNGDVEIVDEGLQRVLVISQEGSNATVVWNPGKEKAMTIADLGEGEYQNFVCVETAITPDSKIILPGDENEVVQSIKLVFFH